MTASAARDELYTTLNLLIAVFPHFREISIAAIRGDEISDKDSQREPGASTLERELFHHGERQGSAGSAGNKRGRGNHDGQ